MPADPEPITPERVLLSAIFRSLSLKKRQHVLSLIGDLKADNVVSLRAARTTEERNRLVKGARLITGAD